MTFEEIKELISVLSDADIAELSVETDDVKVKIKKGAAFVSAPASSPPPVQVRTVSDPAPQPVAAEPQGAPAVDADDRHVTISAPMVGTFYRAPSPDSDPYVKTGDRVDIGQPLCIIEAMKLMNEIESEVQGRVKEILVENGQPVEYGQPLFVIERI